MVTWEKFFVGRPQALATEINCSGASYIGSHEGVQNLKVLKGIAKNPRRLHVFCFSIYDSLFLLKSFVSGEVIVISVLMTMQVACALQCHTGSLESQNTEQASNSLTDRTCNDTVKLCTSTYLNDGWGITITMDCDNTSMYKVSPEMPPAGFFVWLT